MKPTRLALALAALPFALHAQESRLSEVVVTAPQMSDPLVVVNDPKAPQVPVPANDGASFLKNIPGFNVIRKAGTDGDPVLRGLAGSRLNVLLDGAEFHGGCGMRMDPPTAYVFPEMFDKVTVIKGPQTVRYGNGNLAGVVLFDREAKPFTESGLRGVVSAMAGSWGRLDGIGDVTWGTPDYYVRGNATYSDSDDYKDGDGSKVHSAFNRKSVNVMGGWTPDQNTRLELSAVRSEAEAAYADRTMDGVVFDRDGWGVALREEAHLRGPAQGRSAVQLQLHRPCDGQLLAAYADGQLHVEQPGPGNQRPARQRRSRPRSGGGADGRCRSPGERAHPAQLQRRDAGQRRVAGRASRTSRLPPPACSAN